MKKILKNILSFYQRYLTVVFGYGSCRYYPTCSEYAKWQIDNNNIFKAVLFSLLRILRCNQLFRGGIEYPVVKKEFCIDILKTKSKGPVEIKYWFVKKEKNSFYVIKEFKGRKSC